MISEKGVSFDPNFVSSLSELPSPITAGDLQQLLCGLNWMRSTIPRFSELVDPLQQLLLTASRSIDSLQKSQLQKVTLKTLGWNQSHDKCFAQIKSTLQNLVTMAHINDGYLLCVFPDASKDFWGILLT
ncbi:hypothetical protein, partial [Bacillus sp. SRB_331]|uniref:hypothetical protein n=1 Tax=Bacillus sp. SRB_331 TaxID=1969379 RepID=UPI000DC39EF9